MANKYVLEVENVHRVYHSAAGFTYALQGVSLQVPRGEFQCVMGPSGSGKSTLMNILGGLDRPTSGTYRLEGICTNELSDDEMAELRARRLGFVFQRYNLLPRATVIRNVMMPLIYTRVPKAERRMRAFNALRTVGLPERYYDHGSNELSGGQMQRVAIARALVNNPALILADEPTGALDSATSELVMKLFSDLAEQGKTIVCITHDPETCSWGDRTVHIRDGRLFTDEEERALVDAAIKAHAGVQGRRGNT